MRKLSGLALALACTLAILFHAEAQPPDKKGGERPGKAKDYSNSSIVKRMMAFDKNKDGKLTRDEITDSRLLRLFDRADKNKDGVVTKEELEALAAEMDAEIGDGGGRGGPGGPGGKGKRDKGGPPDGDGPGGPGGRGGRGPGGPPRPGLILPPFAQDRLELTDEQKKQVESLQKEVDAKLDKILTVEQKKQLKEMRPGPGPGGPGGRGPGGRGGPPPEDGPPQE
jgi:hypothetical protein